MALLPNKLSDSKPPGWWILEGGRAEDLTRAFPHSRVVAGPRIADRKLELGGDSCLRAVRHQRFLASGGEKETPMDKVVQTLFYKARSKRTGNMWDTWLYHDKGVYYLYYLAKSHEQWDNISLATSPDGVHWTESGPLLRKGKGVTWMGTGSTWRSPHFENDGKFQMNFSEWKGPRQTIFFAESRDLLHWKRLGDEYEFVQDERWYERNGRWDCIWTIPRPGGGLYGYWTATPKPETGGRFGFGQSLDGVTWTALPPPQVQGVGEGEVGAIEKIGKRYYMLFGTGGMMVTLVAGRPEGPFHPAKRNFRLLSGHTYFSRFFPSPNGLLVNHHSMARNGQVYFGTLKSTVVDSQDTLRLGWWKGNEKLKHERVALKAAVPRSRADGPITMLANRFDVKRGLLLEGTLDPPTVRGRERRGLYVECAQNGGAAILVHADGLVELGPMQADGSGFMAEKTVDREMALGKPAKFRLLLKHSLLEFYLDDVLIECFSLPQDSTGRIGLIGGDGVRGLKAWQCQG